VKVGTSRRCPGGWPDAYRQFHRFLEVGAVRKVHAAALIVALVFITSWVVAAKTAPRHTISSAVPASVRLR
jgi:hypothetical protein